MELTSSRASDGGVDAKHVSIEEEGKAEAIATVAEDPIGRPSRLSGMRSELYLLDEYIADLLELKDTDIVVIADDSGSMNSISDSTMSVGGPRTRWEELSQTLQMLVAMLLVVRHPGFFLKFINDAEFFWITTLEGLEAVFAAKPRARGKTPLLSNLKRVIDGHGERAETLLLILTDGEPSDCEFDELSGLIKSKPAEVFCSFAMCTDEGDVVDLYNKVVDPIPGCDITDDYSAECREAHRVGNDLTPFQWLAKMLLVRDSKYDMLDEVRLNKRGKPDGPDRGKACACLLS